MEGERESQEPGAVDEGGFYRVLTHKGGASTEASEMEVLNVPEEQN